MPLVKSAAAIVCVLMLGAVLALELSKPTELPVVQYTEPIPVTTGPVTYYIDNCARCHGPPEHAYVARKAPQRGEALKQVIQHMAEGPAMAPLTDEQLSEQVELHEAIFDNKPFMWIDRSQRGARAGEIIPGTQVELVTQTARYQAHIEGHTFAIPHEPGEIEITRGAR